MNFKSNNYIMKKIKPKTKNKTKTKTKTKTIKMKYLQSAPRYADPKYNNDKDDRILGSFYDDGIRPNQRLIKTNKGGKRFKKSRRRKRRKPRKKTRRRKRKKNP
jgi:hypothetical protein